MSDVFRRNLVDLVPKLRRFAFSLVGNAQDADDLVQAACERALRGADRFRDGTRMDSWMYRIIQNLWLDEKRRSRTRRTKVDPDDAYLSDEGEAAQLPEGQREVLALVAIEGLSYKETAEVLHLPIGTVMRRLSRAREALLPRLGPSEGRRQ